MIISCSLSLFMYVYIYMHQDMKGQPQMQVLKRIKSHQTQKMRERESYLSCLLRATQI